MSHWRPPEGKDLFPFQVEDITTTYYQMRGEGVVPLPAIDAQWDMGLGKTNLSMATAAMLFDDGLLDHVLVVAESGKVRDWADVDFPEWTTLSTGRYMGSKRKEMLKDPPQVLVTTYETGRLDVAVFKASRKRDGSAITGPGPLAEFLLGKRVLIVFDECTRLRTRSSRLHLAWNYLINRYLRKSKRGWVGVITLTGTKMESSPADHYNVNRIVAPSMSPTVAAFEDAYVSTRSLWDNKPTGWRNLSEDSCEDGVVPLSKVYEAITLRRRKSDPEVIDWFPRKVENPSRFITLTKTQSEFYNAIVDILDDIESEAEQEGREGNPDAGMGVLRQVAAAPESLIRSEGQLARSVVEIVGANALRSMGSAKVDAAVDWLREGGDQQSVVFTFFGQSVLPVLHDRFRAEGYTVSMCHGQMTSLARQKAQDAYRAGETQVFLSSDAGARGLNLGVGSLLLHYEMPPLHAIYSQRSDRIHRANSVHPSVTIDSFIVKDTVEEAVWNLLLRRNHWAEAVQDNNEHSEGASDFGYLSADDRRSLWKAARRRS